MTDALVEERHPLYGNKFGTLNKEVHRQLSTPKDQSLLTNKLFKSSSITNGSTPLVNVNSPKARLLKHLASSSPMPEKRKEVFSSSSSASSSIREKEYRFDVEGGEGEEDEGAEYGSSGRDEYTERVTSSGSEGSEGEFQKIRKKLNTPVTINNIKYDDAFRGKLNDDEKTQIRDADDLEDVDDGEEESDDEDEEYDSDFVVDDNVIEFADEKLAKEEEEEYLNAEVVGSTDDSEAYTSEYSDDPSDDDIEYSEEEDCEQSENDDGSDEDFMYNREQRLQKILQEQEKSRLRRQAQPTFGDYTTRGVINSIVTVVYKQATSSTFEIKVKDALIKALQEFKSGTEDASLTYVQRQIVDALKSWLVARGKIRKAIQPITNDFPSFTSFFVEVQKTDKVEYKTGGDGICFVSQEPTEQHVILYKNSQVLTTLYYSEMYEPLISGIVWCWLLPSLLSNELNLFLEQIKSLPPQQKPKAILDKQSIVASETAESFINFFIAFDIIKSYSEFLPTKQ